ncbi:MAG: FAD-dependent oxidoreductase [Spirochaetota bacterium]
MHDLIIIGAGPAGLAAALYATKKRLDYLVLSKDLGGKSNYSVDLPETERGATIRADELVTVYRSTLEYLRHSYRLVGVTGLRHDDDGFTAELEDGSTESARAVIVSTGARVRKLDVPGELTFLSRGLGYSSISYSHLFRGKRVFIAGNTDRAVNSAIELSIHADAVTLALLPGAACDSTLVERARGLDRVEVIENATIDEFRGDEYAREAVVSGDGARRTIEADGFFVEPEPVPNADFVDDEVRRDKDGYIVVDGTNSTNVPGLYAAGDVTGNGYEQILVSLGEGAKAALSAYRYLLGTGLEGR